ncbi:MAG: phosphoribosyl-AMP cyclohydrolase [Pseudomonadota bacterium]
MSSAGEALELGTDFTPRFGPDGTLPVVATDVKNGAVVMLAYMNREALNATIATGFATYWSRSRGSLWIKGESSGNRQRVIELRTDCDQDAIWITVDVEGHGASCHRGYHSCFYRRVPDARLGGGVGDTSLEFTDAAPVFDPADVYKS